MVVSKKQVEVETPGVGAPPCRTMESRENERSETKRSERGRNGGAPTPGRPNPVPALASVPPPDPEVSERACRRQYSAEYKLEILQEADGYKEPGEIGSMLRREGLYSSLLSTWRRQREKGTLAGLEAKKRGRKAKERHPLAKKVAQLEKEKLRLERRLKRAEALLELQKKVSEILEIQLPHLDEENE